MKYQVKRQPITPDQRPPEGAVAIRLTQGWVAWIDACDAEAITSKSWQAKNHGKKGGFTAVHNNVNGAIRMTDVIMGRNWIDHINKHEAIKVIDNRRQNLRPCTHAENMRNARKRIACPGGAVTSPFKGVSHLRAGKFAGRIRVNNKELWLGVFQDEGHAAYAYDLAAIKHFGAFAKTNFEGYPS